MFRFFAILAGFLALSACENIDDISGKPLPIGEFALGHNIVVAPALVKGPVSREGSDEDWIASVTKAIDDRFSRYEGDQLYHFGISLEGYVLAQPGIPLLLSPKSALIIKLTVWDDAEGKKLNEEPEQITILEKLDGDSVIGSGLTKTAEEQMEALSINAAKMIQRYITNEHRQNGWFKRKSLSPKNADLQSDAEAGEDAIEKAEEDVTDVAEPASKETDKAAAEATTEAANATEEATVETEVN